MLPNGGARGQLVIFEGDRDLPTRQVAVLTNSSTQMKSYPMCKASTRRLSHSWDTATVLRMGHARFAEEKIVSWHWMPGLSRRAKIALAPLRIEYGSLRPMSSAGRAIEEAERSVEAAREAAEMVEAQAVFALSEAGMSVRAIEQATPLKRSKIGRIRKSWAIGQGGPRFEGDAEMIWDHRWKDLQTYTIKQAWDLADDAQREVSDERRKQMVEISLHHFLVISEMAAQLSAVHSARWEAEGDVLHPGDAFGTILCEAWLIDPGLALNVAAAFVAKFRQECERAEINTPALDSILLGFSLAINSHRFPTVPVPLLLERLRRQLPGVL